ncbi:flagellar export protein FliJ [uncultured Pseudoflavonifractor sp.]|uniref:flagellar export protein FliJ n=1 Tax=uncultured Pseudoflavonifractor sp. TaxID=1221379 RepID=UPI0025CB9C28|nr:flagellar export protein FliJ [uncultured Pseudoflavonifractor sp.]
MKKFQFSLDNVLSYRQQVLEGQQNEYVKALRRVQEQQARVDDVRLRYQQLNQQFREEAASGITAADAMGFENGLRVLEMEITRESQTLQKLQRAAEEQRAKVLQAHMDAAVLERLKEKKRTAYQKEEQKRDEQFIDELVSANRVVRMEA